MYTIEKEENPTFNLTTKRTEKISLSNNLCGYFYFLFEITNIIFIEIKCLNNSYLYTLFYSIKNTI